MNMEALRSDREALLRYVKEGQWFEGKRVIKYRLLPLRIWEGKQYLIRPAMNLTQEYPQLVVFDVTGLGAALFDDPYVENQQVGILASSSGWTRPRILLESGRGQEIDSSLLAIEVKF